MNKYQQAISYFEDAVKESDEIIAECSSDLQAERIESDTTLIACVCSACDWEAHLYEDDVMGMPYCPNCGAKMEKEG